MVRMETFSLLPGVSIFFSSSIVLFLISLFTKSVYNQDLALTPEEEKYVFIADELYGGIVPVVNQCWEKIQVVNQSFVMTYDYDRDVVKLIEVRTRGHMVCTHVEGVKVTTKSAFRKPNLTFFHCKNSW
jgi:hypothetical protein